MNSYDIYTGDPYYPEATPNDAETSDVSIDDIYNRLDSIDESLSDLQIMVNKDRTVTVVTSDQPAAAEVATSTDCASVTDAIGEVNDNLTHIYNWVMVLAFVIVLFETKRIFRGAIKTFDKD